MGIIGFANRTKGILNMLRESEPARFTKYSEHFSELSFKEKVMRVGELLGDTLLLPILKLYYILRADGVPMQAKLYILGALGYFILPIDLIPDFLPGLLGFSDDLIVVSIILKQVRRYDTPWVTAKAEGALRKICPAGRG